jgi:2-polyprenyl-3-methyl-5-hydroxy-6-metoxy-1,4-benzoquinol methylase
MTKSEITENEFLESVVSTYVTSESTQDRLIKTLAVRTVSPYLSPRMRGLELGCSDGFMTKLLAPKLAHLTVVDGSPTFVEKARSQTAGFEIDFAVSLFEEYSPDVQFDCIFATFVLEHVLDPASFLGNAREWLKDDGILYVVVPNALALSRQLARHMGLISSLHDLTINDINHGHRRVYDSVTLNREVDSAGFRRINQGGIFLKPFADFQMDKIFDSGIIAAPQIEGLYQLGLQYPALAGSIFAVCVK